jgi:hypothetical protein
VNRNKLLNDESQTRNENEDDEAEVNAKSVCGQPRPARVIDAVEPYLREEEQRRVYFGP